MDSSIYEGARSKDGAMVRVKFSYNGEQHTRTLDPRNDLYNHSPDGFEWGYSGSGPAQLALAICADVLGSDERALRVYQRFKARMVAPIDGDDFSITAPRALEVIAEIERELAVRDG